MTINLRQNTNDDSTAYGKYFAEVERKEPINLKGFCRHMTEHGKIASYQMCELVVKQVVECLKELLSQGQPVKIDGLGTFMPTVEATKNGISKDELIAGKWNASTYIRGIHIRFLPEGAGDKDITSRVFKGKCALATYGIEEKIVISGTGTTQDPYVYGKRVTPLSDWIAQQSATTNP